MSTGNGIDLAGSGWDNPEGFTPRARDHGEVKVVKVCEAPGPGGWVCDLPPNHQPEDQHKADDGSPTGLRWTGIMANVQKVTDPEPVLIPAYDPAKILPELTAETTRNLERIREIASKALESPAPTAWAVALFKIMEVVDHA